jgi:hypothetical protein
MVFALAQVHSTRVDFNATILIIVVLGTITEETTSVLLAKAIVLIAYPQQLVLVVSIITL